MAHRFDLVVFDWDGTILDSAGAIAGAIQAASRELGVTPPSDAAARHVIGLGLEEALRSAVPDLSPARYGEMVESYRRHYLSQDQDLVLFPSIESLIAHLAETHHLLGVATGKSRVGLNRALQHSGLGNYFHATRCADECFSKPHPQMLEELMDELGVAPEQVVMIGDTTHDMEMAENGGVTGVAVTYGAHPKAQLQASGAAVCCDSVEELGAWLQQNA